MSLQIEQPEHEFELFKELDKGVWIAIKKGDPHREQFLARRIDAFDDLYKAVSEGHNLSAKDREALAYKDLLYDFNQAAAISRILNHENIVSIVGTTRHSPFIGAESKENVSAEEYLVWDYCDAANLSVLFQDHPLESANYYLPESLCWHVLISLVRAVAWLHDGVRPYSVPAGFTLTGRRYEDEAEDRPVSLDKDWLSVFHRDITPKNIWFQHPRGIETYGPCKLGNFSKAAVTGQVPIENYDDFEDIVCDYSTTKREGWEPLESLQRKLKENPESYKPENRTYRLEDEVYAIGAVVFTMMTGQVLSQTCKKCGCCHIVQCKDFGCCLPPECGCNKGGCKHVNKIPCQPTSNWRPCTHNCPEPSINPYNLLLQSRYSRHLIEAVKEIMEFSIDRGFPHLPISATENMMIIEKMYQLWKRHTEEGREFKDVDDDIAERERAILEKKVEEEKLKQKQQEVACVI